MSDYEEFCLRMKVCGEQLVTAFACLGRVCTKVIKQMSRSLLVNRRTRKAALSGRVAAMQWYKKEHRRRCTIAK